MRLNHCAHLAALLSLSAASVPQWASAAPAIYNLGTMMDYSIGWDINNSGQVLGASYTDGSGGSAFFYTGTPGIDGVMHEISSDWIPNRINDAGQFVGTAPFDTTEEGSRTHATLGTGLPDSVVIFDLGTLRGAGGLSDGRGINNSGQVAGYSQTPGNGGTHAFLYTGVPGSGGVMHASAAAKASARPSTTLAASRETATRWATPQFTPSATPAHPAATASCTTWARSAQPATATTSTIAARSWGAA